MKHFFHTLLLVITLFLCSCDRSRKIESDDCNVKLTISTEYDWFEGHEAIFYELNSENDSILIGKTWCMATGYKDLDLNEFNAECKDSLLILKLDNSIMLTYNLK